MLDNTVLISMARPLSWCVLLLEIFISECFALYMWRGKMQQTSLLVSCVSSSVCGLVVGGWGWILCMFYIKGMKEYFFDFGLFTYGSWASVMDWMLVLPQNSYVELPMWVIFGGGFLEVIRFWYGHEGGTLMMKLVPLWEEEEKAYTPRKGHVSTQWEGDHLWGRKRTFVIPTMPAPWS